MPVLLLRVVSRLPASGASTPLRRLRTLARHLSQTVQRPQVTLESLHTSITSNMAPTSQELSRLEKVLNARDLAEACPRIKPGRLFRSGNPAHASLQDVLTLRESLGVRHMIDFRSSDERREDSAWSLMLSNGVVKEYTRGKIAQVTVDHNAELAGVQLHDIELHQLPLLEKSSFVWALVKRLPLGTLAAGMFWKAVGHEERMRTQLLPEINKGGLQLVYEILMETGTENILKALQLLDAGASAHHPQLFFCKLGKDRTGLLAALVLSACGASREEIIADYARSDGVDQIALGGLEKERDMQGIDTEAFSRAPPEAMQRLLKHAEDRYGGLQQYMVQIGFTMEEQDRLCRNLTSGDW